MLGVVEKRLESKSVEIDCENSVMINA